MQLYQFQKLIKKLGLTDADLSNPLKKRIADIEKLQAAIDKEEAEIAKGNMTLKQKEKLEGKVANAKDALPVMDADLVKAIEKWYPNREKYAAMGQRLQNSRASKALNSNTAPVPGATSNEPNPSPSPSPTPPVKPPKKDEKQVPEKMEANRMGFWGWAGLCLAAVALGTVGVAVAQHMNKKAA
jgi:hypothetical protein